MFIMNNFDDNHKITRKMIYFMYNTTADNDSDPSLTSEPFKGILSDDRG